ncbi:Metallo-beta-lactamase superfamily domain protein [Acididesulfobacillus acetoxydans]|uniref:Integrator complex subunit 11 n=1 Tax=Acididesulfobacillus acetoxydans TaxID=1561005 RepID=A0A8S0XZ37_9FIRM|nr:MBL fold metallo-hydrolase [Acididesulfobacillus acetoxydans]CAA7602357.1 Metallo-beta-lactamase superfamily domain protein [Acididesulfobacillus acetoxydans]CEJ08408.1 Integrator complex subunit 11 [Acididesulfobacillus acetoxydans]
MFSGGAAEVGASCLLLQIAGRNLVFDVGIRMGQNRDLLPDLRMIQESGSVDAIFISHAHMDHIGSLPVLSHEFPQARIFMTHATKELMRVLLFDSLKIMESREQEIPVFAEAQVKDALDRAVCFSPGYTFRPLGENIAVTFYNAGHIAGAVSVYVSSEEGAFFYSGDFSVNPQRTVEGASIPKLRPDVAVFESTYGDRLHANRTIEEERLVAKVKEVLASGKKILIPAFALGRAQEVLLILKRAINKGELPACKIYVDGMVKDICRVYEQNPNYLNHRLAQRILKGNEIFYDRNVTAVTGRQAQREEIVSAAEPCCIVSSSGMLSGGPSQWYAARLAADEGNFIALTGYQDEESPGQQLLALADAKAEERVLKLGDVTIPLKCGIAKYGLSAHADRTEIQSLVQALAPRNAFFVHGNSEVTAKLAQDVQRELRGRVFAPRNGEEYELSLRVPRKQSFKEDLPTLSHTAWLTEEDMLVLWAFIRESAQSKRGFTVEELGYIWSGRRDFAPDEVQQISSHVNHSRYFEAEARRPFIFHVRRAEEVEAEEAPAEMEVNTMLALVDEYFPPAMGLYKKGARFGEKIALLSFVFPAQARQLAEKIAEFEQATGWKVETNAECNQMEAQAYIRQLFGREEDKIEKISYLPLSDAFKVKLLCDPERSGEIVRTFAAQSGMRLILEKRGGTASEGKKTASPAEAGSPPMEQNLALRYIEDALAGIPDRIFKKSLKSQGPESYVELSFASPAVGERYKDRIEQLENEIHRPIRISQSVNQHEVLNMGKRLMEKYGVVLRKNLAFLPRESQVVAYVSEPPGSEALIREEFQRLTGLTLDFARR